jgi:hypothetical protein
VFEMADFHVFEDDQAVLTDFMAVPLDEMMLDYNQAIAGKNRHSRSGCMRQDLTEEERFIHGAETGITPLFTHSTDGLISWHEGQSARIRGKIGWCVVPKTEKVTSMEGDI